MTVADVYQVGAALAIIWCASVIVGTLVEAALLDWRQAKARRGPGRAVEAAKDDG